MPSSTTPLHSSHTPTTRIHHNHYDDNIAFTSAWASTPSLIHTATTTINIHHQLPPNAPSSSLNPGTLAVNSRQYQNSLASFIDDTDDTDPDPDVEADAESVGTVKHQLQPPSDDRDSTAAEDVSDDDESFIYAGQDSTLDHAPGNSADADSDSYSAKMREILGSDSDQDDGNHEPADAASLRQTQGADSLARSNTNRGHQEDQDDDETFQYPDATPHDISFDVASSSSSAHASQRLQTSVSIPSVSISAPNGWSSLRVPVLPTPQRPAAYPSISRLRSSLGPADGGRPRPYRLSSATNLCLDSPSTSSRYRGSPLPPNSASPSASASQLAYQAVPSPPSISSARSRNSSFSFHVKPLTGKRRRKARASFPYGPTPETAQGDKLAQATQANRRHRNDSSRSLTPSLRSDAVGGEIDAGAVASLAWKGKGVLKEAVEEEGEMRRDFVRWSALRKISTQMAADPSTDGSSLNRNGHGARRHAGPTVLAVAGGLVAIGSTDGKATVFDYLQEIKCTCASGDLTGPPGSVSALAFSSDHTFLAVGHETGHIFLYDLNAPGRPSRHVPPVPLSAVKAGRKEGHLNGSKIVHLGFVGLRHTAIVSADSKGLSFYHVLGKILGVSSNDTLRLLGRYPQHEHEYELGLKISKRSTVFGMAPLPLGPRPHAADAHHFVAIMTAGKLVLVGLKPSARTWYRKVRPKHARAPNGDALSPAAAPATASTMRTDGSDASIHVVDQQTSPQPLVPGSLSWYPASTEVDGRRSRQTNPILAFSFGDRLHLIRLVSHKAAASVVRDQGHADAGLVEATEDIEVVELTGKNGLKEKGGDILTLQWISPDLLMLVTKSGLALFDCRTAAVTERMEGDSAGAVVERLVEHDWYNPILGIDPPAAPLELDSGPDDVVDPAPSTSAVPAARRSWAVSHSVRTSKGRTFFLTRTELVVGTLLSWADRLLAYVSGGDFLSAIELATLFYEDRALGSAVGLPSDPNDRKVATAQKLRELMAASADYAFSPDRLTDATHITADGRGVDRTALFEGLARACARACLALGDLGFLFDVLYDRYEDNGIEGIFVGQMEQFIVSGELRTLPIPVVQRLLAFRKKQGEYELAETIIWHVDPKSLDLDQALSFCIDQRLYDAMIYVYNAALEDYVSPIIELLVPLKRILQVRWRVMARIRQAKLEALRLTADDAAPHENHLAGVEGVERSRRPLPSSQPSSLDLSLVVEPEEGNEQEFDDAYKIFSYLSVVLTGHQYPSQEPIADEAMANLAKTTIYSFVFSGRCMLWPPGPGGKLVLFGLEDNDHGDEGEASGYFVHGESGRRSEKRTSEPIYPYLRLFLEFDAEAFLDALDLVFEDPFLDDEDLFGKRISRQLVVDILLDLSRPGGTPQLGALASPPESTTANGDAHGQGGDDAGQSQPALPALSCMFVNIFVARNAPKYPQFIKLATADVDHLLRALSLPDLDDAEVSLLGSGNCDREVSLTSTTREDRQLATEYLLSMYKPDYTEQRLDDFERAGFVRILQSAFRQSGYWDRLLAMLIRDAFGSGGSPTASTENVEPASLQQPQRQAFAHIEEVVLKALRSSGRAELMPKLHALLVASVEDLLAADALQTVALFDRFYPLQHSSVIDTLRQSDENRLLLFLRCFFEPMQVLQSSRRQVDGDVEPGSQGGEDAVRLPADFEGDRFNELVSFASPDHLDDESRDLFVELLSRLDPRSIVRNLDARGAHFFDLETAIVFCQRDPIGAGNAILWCLDRLGRAKEAFDELDKILAGAAAGLGEVVHSSSDDDVARQEEERGGPALTPNAEASRLLGGVRQAVGMAVRLCIERANDFSGMHDSDDEETAPVSPKKAVARPQPIDADEIWFRLLRSLVKLVHDVAGLSSSTLTSAAAMTVSNGVTGDEEHGTVQQRISSILSESREIVQETLSMLIASTAAEAVSFPDLFRRLVGDDGARSEGVQLAKYYTEIRAVLEGMLGAYKLRSDLLKITNKLFERDTFNQFRRLTIQRKRGWRPASGQATCSGCGLVAVGRKRGKAMAATVANGSDPTSAPVWSSLSDSTGMSRRSSRHRGLDVSPGNGSGEGNLRRRVLRQNSISSLTVPQTPLRRRPMTPYDEKAALLSSPSIDKGKGVVRNITASQGFDDDIDGYFSGPSSSLVGNGQVGSSGMSLSASADSLMFRSASYASGMSLRIDYGATGRREREDEHAFPSQSTSMARARSCSATAGTEGSATSMTRQISDDLLYHRGGEGMERRSSTGRGYDGGTRLVNETVTTQEKMYDAIVVLQSGMVYHETCWLDATSAAQAAGESQTPMAI